MIKAGMEKIRSIYYLPLLIALGAVGTVNASLPEIVDITTSNTTGVAPLGVHFDVSRVEFNGQLQDPLRDISYRWHFGDESGQRWSTNEVPKNTDEGFIAAHLYEIPGTYEVRVVVSSLNKTFDPIEKTLSITVLDPDIAYSGDNTICFSVTNNFVGCPVGAQQIELMGNASAIEGLVESGKFMGKVLDDKRVWNTYLEYVTGNDHDKSFEYVTYDDEWSCVDEAQSFKDTLMSSQQVKTFASENKRLLFARGEIFRFYDTLKLDSFNGSTIGAFGQCDETQDGFCSNAPKLDFLAQSSTTDMFVIEDTSTVVPQNTDIRISDLSISRICGDKNRAINLYGNVSQVVLNRLDITELDSAIVGRTYGQKKPHDVIGIFNSKFGRLGSGTGVEIDPEDETCDMPPIPEWHDEDGQTPNPNWTNLWGEYKENIKLLAENPDCEGGGYNMAYLPSHRHMLMGNIMYDARTKRAEHIIRVSLAHKSLFSHNIFDDPSPNKHALKLHNMGDCELIIHEDDEGNQFNDCVYNPVQSATMYPTSDVLIHKNFFKANTDIVVNIGPGTSKVGEQVNNILFDSNRIEASGGENQVALVLSSHHSTVSNNQFVQTFDEGEGEASERSHWNAVVIGQARNEPAYADNNWVVGNIAYINGSSDFVGLNAESNGANIQYNRMCSGDAPSFVDLNDPTVTYTAGNNYWDCTQPDIHLSFDDATAPSLDNVSGTLAEVNGGPVLQVGGVNTAMSFNSVGDEIIIPDPMSEVDNTEAFSLMTWINVADFSTGGEAFGRPRVGRQGDVSLSFDTEGRAIFYLNSLHFQPGITLSTNEWAHLALTFNLKSRLAKIYLNGSVVYEYAVPESSDLFFSTGQEFRLGVGQWRSGSKHFSGSLDEFRFYNTELSAEVISQQVQLELGQFY